MTPSKPQKTLAEFLSHKPVPLSYELRQALKKEAEARETTASVIIRTMLVNRLHSSKTKG